MKEIKDMSASVRNRLNRKAKSSKADFNAVLRQYFQERALFRLSISPYRDHFVLKGALLFHCMQILGSRMTKDIDFLGVKTSNDQARILEAFKSILSIDFDDGVRFDIDSIHIEVIAEQKTYSGWRIHCVAFLGQARQRIKMDVGFGDVIVPEAHFFEYPVMLDDFPSPEILVYSLETAIAEKFEAIVFLGYQTSRMKDFYDIHFMSDKQSFEAGVLRKAIHATFDNRNTRLSDYREVFTEDYRGERQKQIQWKAFLRKTGIPSELSFSDCVAGIEKFLDPVLCSNDLNAKWNPELRSWEPKEGD